MMKSRLLLLWLVGASSLQAGLCQVLGDVFLYEAGRGEREPVHFDPFPDLPADFGPEVPDEGVDGLLLVADPEDACQPFKFRFDDEPWVALISRSQHLHPTNCTFDVKVRNAELAGASAAIVYDDVYEALIIMSKPRDHDDPGIPAVFVSEKAGIIMRKLMTPGVTRVRIVPVSASAWMSLLMSAFLGFLALTVVLATFYVMRSWSRWLGRTRRRGLAPELAGFGAAGQQAAAQEGLPACAIRALPILIYEGKAGKRRSSSSTAGSAKLDGAAGPQPAPSAPVPVPAAPYDLAVAAAASSDATHAAWMPATPSMMPLVQQAAAGAGLAALARPTAETSEQPHAAVLIESDSVGEGLRPSTAGVASSQEQQQSPEQLSGSIGQRLASSSSAVTSGLISLASLAAAGSRRMLLLGGQSPLSSPPLTTHLEPAHTSTCVHPGGQMSGAEAAGSEVVAAAAAVAAAGASDDVSAAGSESGHSSLYSTDDEDMDPPEVAQSWPGAGSLARGVVTGGPVGARGGATRHTCVVCLERYTAGDKVRVLPCQHRFHAVCIDPWLASRRLCPVCKHDASTWPSNSMQAALSGSPLLGGYTSGAAGQAAAAEPGAAVGVSLLSVPLSAGMVSLGRRLRARLARASRRRQQQQQQQQQQQHVLQSTVAGGASPAAAVAEAAEAGLLRAPPAALTVAEQSQGPQQLGTAQQHRYRPAAVGGAAGLAQPQQQPQSLEHQPQQQLRQPWLQQTRGELYEPLLSPAASTQGAQQG